jgi:hypothetical protein
MIDGLINTFGIESFSMYKIILQNNFTYKIFLNILQIYIYMNIIIKILQWKENNITYNFLFSI